jgi:hypothetical protein
MSSFIFQIIYSLITLTKLNKIFKLYSRYLQIRLSLNKKNIDFKFTKKLYER